MTMCALRCRFGFSTDHRKASSISFVEHSVEKIDEYDLACTDSMNAMFVYTASSCGVIASGVSVLHDWMSFDSGTFSGSQKLFTRRFHTSRSLSSWMRFQLIA